MSEHEALIRRIQNAIDSPHYACDDCWYSCPKGPDGCCDERVPKDQCTCGKDGMDALLRDVLTVLQGKGAMGVGDQHRLEATSGPDTAPTNTVSHPEG